MEPTFLISFMLIMPQTIENSTIGTTMNFSRFTKIVPMGLMNLVAKAAPPGTYTSAQPMPAPMMSAKKIQNASDSFFLPVDMMFTPRITKN